MDYTKQIKSYIELEQQVLSELPVDQIDQVIQVLEKARLSRKQIYICGNGGSASTASHFESDFNKGISCGLEIKYNFKCLNDNIPLMTAIANDIGYDSIFLTQLDNKIMADDILIGISGSGNSENIIKAFQYATVRGAKTIALVGYDGGKMMRIADYVIHINVNHMQVSEDVHLMLGHMMMSILRKCT